jgi:hypothetical protein
MRHSITSAFLAGLLLLGFAGLSQAHHPFAPPRPVLRHPGCVVSPEAQVDSWYHRYLHRCPDPYASAWIESLRCGQPPEKVLAGILGSDEYYGNAGNNPCGFIRTLFRDVVGRPPSPAEEHCYQERLASGVCRNEIACSILTVAHHRW